MSLQEGTLAPSGFAEETAMRDWNPYQASCPTRLVLARIADKWALLVLGALSGGPVRFNDLKRRIEGVSQKMLSQTLKNLERDGLVKRAAFATVPVTVEYSITPLGRTLTATFDALRNWACANMKEVQRAQKAYDGKTKVKSGARRARPLPRAA
jgi:DNA-binding HxlR family transcriptional regulator